MPRGAHNKNMDLDFTLPFALALLAVAAFAQWTIPQFTRGTRNAWALRLLLIVLGLAVGYTLVRVNGATADSVLPLFLLGFGLVHVPPAIVLLLKRWRKESPS